MCTSYVVRATNQYSSALEPRTAVVLYKCHYIYLPRIPCYAPPVLTRAVFSQIFFIYIISGHSPVSCAPGAAVAPTAKTTTAMAANDAAATASAAAAATGSADNLKPLVVCGPSGVGKVRFRRLAEDGWRFWLLVGLVFYSRRTTHHTTASEAIDGSGKQSM